MDGVLSWSSHLVTSTVSIVCVGAICTDLHGSSFDCNEET